MKRVLVCTVLLISSIGLWICVGCGGSGGAAGELPPGNDPVVEVQAAETINPGLGGTVSTDTLSITFPRNAVQVPTEVILQELYLDPYKDAIPNIPGKLVKVSRIRPEHTELWGGNTATLTYQGPGFLPGAEVTVYRQEASLELVGPATQSGDDYSLEIDRLGIYFWVLESNFCLRFDGYDDHVSIPHHSSIKFNTHDPFTIEFWFRTSEAPSGNCVYRVFVGTWSGGAVGVSYPYEARLWLGSNCWAEGSLALIVFDGSSGTAYDVVRAMGSWNDGQWHHYAGIRDGTNIMRIYVDGTLTGSKVPSPDRGPIYNWRPVTLGGDPLNWHILDGCMDEVRIWNGVRNETEIQSNMYQRLTGSEPGLAALWNFDEGGGGIVGDSTASANNAIVVGDPQWPEAPWSVSP